MFSDYDRLKKVVNWAFVVFVISIIAPTLYGAVASWPQPTIGLQASVQNAMYVIHQIAYGCIGWIIARLLLDIVEKMSGVASKEEIPANEADD